jgi:hypothetical protein
VLDEPIGRASAATRIVLAVSATATIALVAACRLDSGTSRFESNAAIEQRDLNLRRALRETNAREYRDFQNIDWDDVPDRIAANEAVLAHNPDDLDTLRQILLGYWIRPSIEKRRANILRLIEQHPDAELAGAIEARLFAHDLDATFTADPVGYAQAKKLWLALAERPDASVAVLGNASYFFEGEDKPLAESLLLRARVRDPSGPWTARLGRFYARTLTGARGPSAGSGTRTHTLRVVAVADPRSPYSIAVRKQLGESTDDELLAAAGWFLARAPRWMTPNFDADLWAESCFKRALQLNPQAIVAHSELLALASRHERNRGEALWEVPPARQYAAVSSLPEAERFARLPALAQEAYGSLRTFSRWDDPNLRDRVALAEQQARLYAQDALALAPKYRNHPQYGTAIYAANVTLAGLALRGGDTATAVKLLMKAADAPASEELAYGDDVMWELLRWHLTADFVERGQRDVVVTFLKRMAETSVAHRTDLRAAAAAISRGETPKL